MAKPPRQSIGSTVVLSALLLVLAPAALAQGQRPATLPVPNPAMEAAERAFMALPEAERRAIQSDLIWGSDFTATISGAFGARTYQAIVRFEQALRSPADGILDPAERRALTDTATRARAAAKFARQVDAKTGAALSLPLATFSKRDVLPNGTRWTSADGAYAVETANAAGGAEELPQAFERIVGIPGRKVTYKLLRPDFFVVAGEAGPRAFYTRFGIGQGRLVGYTIAYPAAQARAAERTVIALANSFEPAAGAAPVSSATGPAGQPQPGGTPTPQTPPAPAAGILPPGLILTGLVTAPGTVLTAGLAGTCPDLTVNGRPARLGGNAPTGFALLEADTGPLKPLAAQPVPAQPGADVLIIGFVPGGAQPQLALTSGTLAGQRVLAPLHREGGGSLVLTRSGDLVGLVAPPRATPRLVAGFVPAESHALIVPGTPAAKPAGPPLTGGALAARVSGALVAIRCGQPVPLPKS